MTAHELKEFFLPMGNLQDFSLEYGCNEWPSIYKR